MATLIVLKSDEQQRLSKLKKEDRREDLISILPNAILQHILSFLPTKDIIRTSILCKRWKNLWTSISNIDLGDSIDITKSDYLKRRASFLDSVERILLQHDDSDIKRLHLSFKMPSLSGVRDFSDVPVFQNLIHLKVVREMSRRTIDILLDLMQRTPNLRILEIAEEAPILLLKHFLKHSAVIQRVVVHYPNNASDYMGKREEFKNQLLMLPRISENCVIEVLDWPL